MLIMKTVTKRLKMKNSCKVSEASYYSYFDASVNNVIDKSG